MHYLHRKKAPMNFTTVTYMQFKFPGLAIYTVSLPLIAFLFCVIWSLAFFFESSTFTHCQVLNYLPSVSATIGSYATQRYVWQVCIFLHSAPRYLIVCMYYSHLCDVLLNHAVWQWLSCVVFLLQLSEVSSLLGLTFVPSSENFNIHKFCFTAFMVTSTCNMIILYLCLKFGTKQSLSSLEKLSLSYKFMLAFMNITSAFLAMYFYFRHNWYCEPMVYTFFAFFEYVVVVTNMGYHMTAYWDFTDHLITVSSCCTVSVTNRKKQHTGFPLREVVIKVA